MFVIFILIYKFILIYLLHILLAFKIKSIFKKKNLTQNISKGIVSYIYTPDSCLSRSSMATLFYSLCPVHYRQRNIAIITYDTIKVGLFKFI